MSTSGESCSAWRSDARTSILQLADRLIQTGRPSQNAQCQSGCAGGSRRWRRTGARTKRDRTARQHARTVWIQPIGSDDQTLIASRCDQSLVRQFQSVLQHRIRRFPTTPIWKLFRHNGSIGWNAWNRQTGNVLFQIGIADRNVPLAFVLFRQPWRFQRFGGTARSTTRFRNRVVP